MEIDTEDNWSKKKFSRREFINMLGLASAGLFATPFIKSGNAAAYDRDAFLAQVAVTQADNYDRSLIKQRVQHLFDSLGGISDIVKPGHKVAIKINLTGGSGSTSSPKLNGKPITESMWTHPEVLRAVGELIIDCGVSANDIYIVEALWDSASYNNFGYLEVQQSLGAQLINLNSKEPYADFIDKPVGENRFFYESFKLNKILADVDVYVSIPKMKQHYDAGVTHSLKNQIGIVPIQFYMQNAWDGRRSKLHFEGGDMATHLPHSICDLNLTRPIHLAVIDGIKNAIGGEGVWNSTFETAEYQVLLAGKDPVATDSIASYLMGNDPEAEKFELPDGVRQCDNYLELLHQRAAGTNQLSEIEAVGDGAGLVTKVRPNGDVINSDDFQLLQNYPNPFNPATTIKFHLPKTERVTMKIYTMTGQEVETLINREIPGGPHEIHWTAKNLANGVYVCRMKAGKFSEAKKMILQK